MGKQVVSYTYDTWGKLISITGDKALGEKNPYRYRGYRYDTETGYYYLQSRYYNPEWGRFLNADVLISTGHGLIGNNIFAYCLNNPTSNKDDNGFLCSSITDGATTSKYTKTTSNNNSGFSYKNSVISGAINVGTAVADYAIGSKIASKLSGFTKYKEWTYNPSNYIYKLKLNKTGKALSGLKGVGAVTLGITSIQTFNNIRKGEVFGAVVDLGATAAGVGVGILGSYVISLGADYLKDKHYGR
ncbi:RHS repeat-associated core domain-containing protein [Clostridium sp.]|uniref:RHS repeat-associated core domain-containing protein n=1 Tax=Clostridium sp. TaxID=1506 RepID=UPI0032176F3B